MRAITVALIAVLGCGVAACGGSAQSTGAGPRADSSGAVPACGGGRPVGASYLGSRGCGTRHPPPPTGAATIRHRAGLCFTDQGLRLDAGEALGSIEPGQRFPGRHRIVHKYFDSAIGNVVRSLRTAKRFADAETRPAVDRITRLAHAGIRQIRRHPSLIVHGGIGAFHRANRIARRAGLRSCLS